MGSHSTKGCLSPSPLSAPAPDYNVTGEVSPDCTCNYYRVTKYGGKWYYKRCPVGWSIWWRAAFNQWVISAKPGYLGGSYWVHYGSNIEGLYVVGADATGTATVSAGGH